MENKFYLHVARFSFGVTNLKIIYSYYTNVFNRYGNGGIHLSIQPAIYALIHIQGYLLSFCKRRMQLYVAPTQFNVRCDTGIRILGHSDSRESQLIHIQYESGKSTRFELVIS